MASSINFLSLNVGMSSSLAGLISLIPAYDIDISFLQEVRLSREQIDHFLDGLGFQAEVNVDHEHPSTPGTAIAWKKTLPVIVSESLGIVQSLGSHTWLVHAAEHICSQWI